MSRSGKKKKRFSLQTALTDVHHPYYFFLSDVLAIATVVSIVSIVLETVPSFTAYHPIFQTIEWVTVVIFTIEYVWRLWLAKYKLSYLFSWFGILDLVAIVPTYLGLGNWTFLKSARIIRLMRLLRLLRMSKMRNMKHGNDDEQLSFYSVNILLFLTVLVSAALLIGILIYIVEGTTPAFQSIPHGMWWAFRIFTNDPTFDRVASVGGEVVYIFARLTGLIVFGALVGILGNVVKKVVFGEGK